MYYIFYIFMHLVDAFIQSDLRYIQVIHTGKQQNS